MTADETETDWFDWLPVALSKRGSDGPPPVKRIEQPVTSGVISGLNWGNGPTRVVLLHGAGQNAHTWDLVACLAGSAVLALDLPGHGHSSWREDQDYSPARNAATIAQALDNLRVRPDLVVGMSLGGLTTIALISERPDLVPRAVVVDVLPGIAETVQSMSRADLGQVDLLAGPREFESLDHMVAVTAKAVPARSLDAVRRGVIHNAVRTADGRFRWRYDELLRSGSDPEELWTALADSTAPLLLVRGGASKFVASDAIDRLHRIRPDVRVETVVAATHAVQSSAPDELAALIRAFMLDGGR